jgi:hypothetical protein
MRTLFLGGPADGQWLHVPPDAVDWYVSSHHYRYECLRCARQTVHFFVVEELSMAGALEALLHGYQRPPWSPSEAQDDLLVWVLQDVTRDEGCVLGVFLTPQFAWQYLRSVERPGCPDDVAWTVEPDGDYTGTASNGSTYTLTWFEVGSEVSLPADLAVCERLSLELKQALAWKKD